MKKNLKFIIIGVVVIGLIVGYYLYLSNKPNNASGEEVTTGITQAQKLLARSMATDYPPTPKEVVKYYADLTVAFYTSDYTDEEFEKLADRLRDLFDAELLAANPREYYIQSLKNEIDKYKSQGSAISSYATSASTDVDYGRVNGYDCAKLRATFTLKNGANVALIKEIFILRKDEDGHYKIYGWKLADDEQTEN